MYCHCKNTSSVLVCSFSLLVRRLQDPEQSISTKRKSGERRPLRMNKALLDKLNKNRQLPEAGRRETWPGRNAEELPEQPGIRLGKLKPCQK